MVLYKKYAGQISRGNGWLGLWRLRQQRPATPSILTLAVTYRCNVRCQSCGIWQRPPMPELAAADIIRIVQRCGRLLWVNITGGEPTVRPDLTRIISGIATAARGLLLIHVTTNGQKPEMMERLTRDYRGTPRLFITVSIDGPAAVHDRQRGCDGAYQRCIETIARINRQRRPRAVVSCTLAPATLPHVPELLRALRRDIPGFSPADINYNIAHHSAHFYQNCGLTLLSAAERQTAARLMRRPEGGLVKRWLQRRYARVWDTSVAAPPCVALRHSCFIDPTGMVYPCIHYNRPLLRLAADNDYDMRAEWQGAAAAAMRAAIQRNDCGGCWSPCEAYPAIIARALGYRAVKDEAGSARDA